MMRWIAQACLLLVTIPAYGQSSSLSSLMLPSICGTVQDEHGAPAAFVKVAAGYTGGHTGMDPMSTTDGSGHYCIKDIIPEIT